MWNASPLACRHQWGVATRITGIHVRTRLDQYAGGVKLTKHDGAVECTRAFEHRENSIAIECISESRCIDVGSLADQHTCNADVPLVDGDHEGAIVFAVVSTHFGASFQQSPNSFNRPPRSNCRSRLAASRRAA